MVTDHIAFQSLNHSQYKVLEGTFWDTISHINAKNIVLAKSNGVSITIP